VNSTTDRSNGRGRAGPPCRLSKRRPLRLDSPTPAALAPPETAEMEEEEQPGACAPEPLPSQLGEPSRWGCGGFLSEGIGLVQNRCELQLVVSFFFLSVRFFPNS
jgi:hypothetical protein